jgi:16S rRNA (cytosine967-C5)-methyltransferase
MHFHSYFNTSVKIIQLYNGSIPLSYFLKQYFAANKKHGSKDRKLIAHACYCYFRLGQALQELNIEDRLKAAIFLCNENADDWDILYNEEWLKHRSSSLHERVNFITSVYNSFSRDNVFPFADHLSEGIDTTAFIQSHFVQPGVFLRIRPHHHGRVINALQQNNILFSLADDDCIELAATTSVEKILKLDEEAVVQDYSSQQIKSFLHLTENPKSYIPALPTGGLNPKSVWDCCAGSGGKAILVCDVLENIQLTATDIRPSIIHNLQKRFQKAGVKDYKSFVVDITNSKLRSPNSSFDLIICDAPCTGSGTWSRTPEQLYFFRENKIAEYVSLQQEIVAHTISRLKTGGYFLYITCSVFKKENEEIAGFIKNKFHLQLIKMELLKGYYKKADTMFAALFRS